MQLTSLFLAFYEIAEGEVTYKRTKEGINRKNSLVSLIQGILKGEEMRGKHIIVAVSAGIAAYKAIEVVADFVKRCLK